MKRLLLLVICLAMLLTLIAGCGKPAVTEETKSTSASTSTAPATTKAEPAKIVVVSMRETAQFPDQQLVVDEMNKYTLGKINVQATLKMIDLANYSQQVNLMITSREDMDLVMTTPLTSSTYTVMTAQKQLLDITDLLPKYAQATLDAINAVNPKYLDGVKVNGRIYAVPNLFDKVGSSWASFPTAILQKYNLDLKAVKNIDDMEKILEVLKKNETAAPWFAPMIGLNYQDFSGPQTMVDNLGDGNYLRYGAIIGDGNTKVVNYYASDIYRQWLDIARKWYLKGYMYKDYATTNDRVYTFIQSGAVLGCFDGGQSEYIYTLDGRAGKPMTVIRVGQGPVATGVIQQFCYGLPVQCDQQEAALKWMNLMFTDETFINMINYGIKGTHYVENPDGSVKFPDGVNAQNTKYKTAGTFIFGNQFLSKPFAPMPGDLRKKALEINKTAKTTPTVGMSVNTSSFANELSAVSNVIDKYRKSLDCGASDPAKVLPEFLGALDKAGMPKIIAEVQKQVDAFTKK